jgi:polysaccharide pyruvyl transferase WcaK-like protein
MKPSRRSLLATIAAASCRVPEKRRPRVKWPSERPTILVRSGWQTVNIGDIAHTPGLLRLIERLIPEAEVMLWTNALDRGVDALLERNFPKVRIVSSETGENGEPDTEPLRDAFEKADLLVHGSAAGVQRRHLEAWRRRTGKPYGMFGVTVAASQEAVSQGLDEELRALLEGAEFVFTRETRSLENVRRAGVAKPEVRFVPDATFSLQLANEPAAREFLARNHLEPKKFIAVIPRLRYTPYHKIRKVDWSAEEIRRRTETNEKHQESDHAKLREVITTWVRRTGHKALLCPEMTYQLDIIDPLLYDPLPAEIKKSIVRRQTYWLTDEAASVYRRAAAVVSFECHSPIIAATVDTPCIYVHQPEDGIKGQMWEDIGLSRWHLEVEEATGEQIAERLMDIHQHYAAAQVDVHEAVLYARKLHTDAVWFVRNLFLG